MASSDLLNAQFLEQGRIAFFPVRHHSPAAAVFVEEFIKSKKPAAVLIEGPENYNNEIAELCLDHEFPIAIYSYCRSKEKTSGVFYPLSEHSPEYTAIKTGLAQGLRVEFIDLPLQHFAELCTHTHRYNDGNLQRSDTLKQFFDSFSVSNFNALWDKLIESNDQLTLDQYLSVAHAICLNLRESLPADQETTLREEFMTARINDCLKQTGGLILVVTGGLHSSGILALLQDPVKENAKSDSEFDSVANSVKEQETLSQAVAIKPLARPEILQYGCTLTPFSDEKLDSYRGYEAGLPSPGFYYQAWLDRLDKSMHETHRSLLAQAVGALRAKKQLISTADVITAENMACGLAALRGHSVVFREDLMDGITSAVAKDELTFEDTHPLVKELRAVFRGARKGRLSQKTKLPPLTLAIQAMLDKHDLTPHQSQIFLDCDLSNSQERSTSQVLHKMRNLAIAGFKRINFSGLAGDESGKVLEHWEVRQVGEFHASCIEAAAWGATVEEAVTNRIRAKLTDEQADTETVAIALTQASLMALEELSDELSALMDGIICSDCSLLSVVKGLSSLLDLVYYEQVLSHRPLKSIKTLLKLCLERALWLLEYQGTNPSEDFVAGIKTIIEITQLHGAKLGITQPSVCQSLSRARTQTGCSALVAGALSGALWKLQAPEMALIAEGLLEFSLPDNIGDYILGLLTVAGDLVHSDPEIIHSIDKIIASLGDNDFLLTVPSLRLAFSKYSPREKVLFLQNLLRLKDGGRSDIDLDLEIDPQQIMQVIQIENRVKQVMSRYGLRGADD